MNFQNQKTMTDCAKVVLDEVVFRGPNALPMMQKPSLELDYGHDWYRTDISVGAIAKEVFSANTYSRLLKETKVGPYGMPCLPVEKAYEYLVDFAAPYPPAAKDLAKKLPKAEFLARVQRDAKKKAGAQLRLKRTKLGMATAFLAALKAEVGEMEAEVAEAQKKYDEM